MLGALLAVSVPGAMQGDGQVLAGGHWPGWRCQECPCPLLWELGVILSPHGHAVFSVKNWEARKGGEVWNKDAGIILD